MFCKATEGNKHIQWGKLIACGDFSSVLQLSKLKHPKYANHGNGRYVFKLFKGLISLLPTRKQNQHCDIKIPEP